MIKNLALENNNIMLMIINIGFNQNNTHEKQILSAKLNVSSVDSTTSLAIKIKYGMYIEICAEIAIIANIIQTYLLLQYLDLQILMI